MLRSMTGFARADGAVDGAGWTWEIRTVNGRGLDLRLRLPPGFDAIEPKAREKVAERLVRGNVQATLSVNGREEGVRLRLNEQLLGEVEQSIATIRDRLGVGAVSAEGIMSIRGLLETESAEMDDEARQRLHESVLAGLDGLLNDLVSARENEGSAIAGTLNARTDELERLVERAEEAPARTPEAIRERLAEQVQQLLDARSGELDAARLHQEAVLLATRADIREELDRLQAHIAAARKLFAEGGAIGRRLEFLSQEFNREVNTICSKSNDLTLTEIGLEMKTVVDQFREQVQNLE